MVHSVQRVVIMLLRVVDIIQLYAILENKE